MCIILEDRQEILCTYGYSVSRHRGWLGVGGGVASWAVEHHHRWSYQPSILNYHHSFSLDSLFSSTIFARVYYSNAIAPRSRAYDHSVRRFIIHRHGENGRCTFRKHQKDNNSCRYLPWASIDPATTHITPLSTAFVWIVWVGVRGEWYSRSSMTWHGRKTRQVLAAILDRYWTRGLITFISDED